MYYVYIHINPETKEIVYVGKGSGGRAWDVTRCRGGYKDHQEWMLSLISKGYIPSDWVQIEHRNLSERDALKLEAEYLHENGLVKFNRKTGEHQHQAKLTNEQALEIYKRVVHNKERPLLVAQEFNISKAAVYHIKNRKQWKAVTAGVRHEEPVS